jgi:signal transduction histidine kinase
LPIGLLISSRGEASPDDNVHDVAERFFRDPGLEALALTELGRPVGLVTRARILLTLARSFGQELFARKPISRMADASPLVLPGSTDVVAAIGLALQRPAAAVYDEVVVVDDDGRYRGLLSVKSLVLHQGFALARSLVEREAALARAADLEELERMRARFLAHTTHELRSPVSAVVMIAELIRRHAEREDWRMVAEKVPVLLRMASALRTTVDNVLDLSKLEAGKEEVDLDDLDLGRVLQDVAELARLACHGKPVAVAVDPWAGPPLVRSDEKKLRQILINLASNAAKFTERGEVRLGAAMVGGLLRLRVTDTGIGIRPEDLPRLFMPFGQLEEAATRTHPGTGLGLVIARSMAKLLGGRIEVESRHGAGSTFFVLLPIQEGEITHREPIDQIHQEEDPLR